MNIIHKHHKDYKDILDVLASKKNKISVILPSRNEFDTIGEYLPKFARLMSLGYIHEIILADSSDDSKAINNFLESAMKTKPFAQLIQYAINNKLSLPIKAVNVFDPRFSKLFGKKKTLPGKAPGKGRTMYVGMAIATGSHYIFLDSDFYNIDQHFLTGLIGPIEKDDAKFVKATFELEDEWNTLIKHCHEKGLEIPTHHLLMKSINSRIVAKPLLSITSNKLKTHKNLDLFNGPLSGGYGADAKSWKEMKIPTRYGVEIYSIMELTKKFSEDTKVVDVNLGIVNQTSADSKGQRNMGKNIIGAYLRYIQENNPDKFEVMKTKPEIFKLLYIQQAMKLSVHVDDPEIIRKYAKIIEKRLLNPNLLKKTFILPALEDNTYFIAKENELKQIADRFTIERLEILELLNKTETTKSSISVEENKAKEVEKSI